MAEYLTQMRTGSETTESVLILAFFVAIGVIIYNALRPALTNKANDIANTIKNTNSVANTGKF